MAPIELDFPSISSETWRNKIFKELKENTHLLEFYDTIENLSFDVTNRTTSTGSSKIKSTTNDWKHLTSIDVTDEKKANQEALQILEHGCDGLYFILPFKAIDFNVLCEKIDFQYIHSIFCCRNQEQVDQVRHLQNQFGEEHIQIVGDESNSVFDWQQLGANVIQQVVLALIKSHQQILQNEGKTSQLIEFGIGSNYFVETAKFIAFRKLNDFLKKAYSANCDTVIIGKTGWMNKSLRDPYTNILRLTTEIMSAANAGLDYIVVQAYDQLSEKGADFFSHRMGVNIGHILKEESYFNIVQFPLEGSYVLENLIEEITKKAWELFQTLDHLNEKECMEKFQSLVLETRQLRIEQWNTSKDVLIGVNKFPNPEKIENTWKNVPEINGIPYLFYETL